MAKQTLEAAIGILMAHPNMAPFISRQFIQRLVTSNPSPDYVSRVATVFKSTQGDMKSVITAILTDTEATSDALLSNPLAGKLREPVVRFIQWARTFQLNFSPTVATQWAGIGDLSEPVEQAGRESAAVAQCIFLLSAGLHPAAYRAADQRHHRTRVRHHERKFGRRLHEFHQEPHRQRHRRRRREITAHCSPW